MGLSRALIGCVLEVTLAGCSPSGTEPDTHGVSLVLPDTIRGQKFDVGGSQSGGRLYCLFQLPAAAEFGPAGSYIKWTEGRMDRLEIRIQGRASTPLPRAEMAAAFGTDSLVTGQSARGSFRFDAGGPYYGDFALRYVRGPHSGAATAADSGEAHVQLKCDVT